MNSKRFLVFFVAIACLVVPLCAQEAQTSEQLTPNDPSAPTEQEMPGNQATASLSLQLGVNVQNHTIPTSYQGVEDTSVWYSFGVWYHMPLGSAILLLGGDIWADEYVYLDELSMAVPTQIETGSEVGPLALVIGVSPGARIGLPFYLSQDTSFYAGLGIDLALRLPLLPLDNSSDIGSIALYNLGMGRFLFIGVDLQGRFKLSELFDVGPWLKTRLPIFRLLDGSNLGLADTLIVGGGISIYLDL